MSKYHGLTWGHERGQKPLEAANELLKAQGNEFTIEWSSHSLEGFESAPIGALFEKYDLIVLDYPHLGDAVETQMLKPIDEIFDLESLRALEKQFVGPSLRSYQIAGKTLALPLDAATQVAAKRPDLLDHHVDTWAEVIELSQGTNVALSLAGPHAFLSFLSAYAGLEGRTNFTQAAFVMDRDKAIQAIETFQAIYANRKVDYLDLNPIGLLELMSAHNGPAYIPLVYGYVNYSNSSREHQLVFEDVPVFDGYKVHGSVIGGTGIGISQRAEITDEFVSYLKWIIGSEAQCNFIPRNFGQPARTEAWKDEDVNQASDNFYRNTLSTIEDSMVRPRFPRYTEFQSLAAQIVRDAVVLRQDPANVIDELEVLAARYVGSMAKKYA